MAASRIALQKHPHQRSLVGKLYVLGKDTVALRASKPRLIHIPSGAIVKVISDSGNSDGTIEVLWEGDPVVVFKIDLEERGNEVTDRK
jgi:hypothetical protein